MEIEITYSDPEFFKALANPDGFMPELQAAMSNIVTEYKDIAAEYAPESEANRPGRKYPDGSPKGYYERGVGWWSPEGGINPMSLSGVSGFKRGGFTLYKTSQQMNQRWVTSVSSGTGEVMGRLQNTATYSDEVQGVGQSMLHAGRGWKTVLESWLDEYVQQVVWLSTKNAIENYYNLGA